MRNTLRLAVLAVPVLLAGACTTLSDSDRALISSARQDAAEAKAMAQQALELARAADTKSAAASQSAAQAAADARAANEKADRIFQRSLRKP